MGVTNNIWQKRQVGDVVFDFLSNELKEIKYMNNVFKELLCDYL